MPEDCLMALASLLSLPGSSISNAHEVFRELPNTKLYNQLAAYYYALQFYRTTHSIPAEALRYDPIMLIRAMLKKAENSDESEIQKSLLNWGRILTGSNKTEENSEDADVSSNAFVVNEAHVIEDIPKDEDKSQVDCSVKSESTTKSSNLYETLSFKVTESGEAEEEAGWDDDNWGDFSEHSDEEDIVVEEVNPIPIDEPSKEVENLNDESTEAERYRIFEQLFTRIETKDHYSKTKKILLQFPVFTSSEFTSVENHPILRMLTIVKTLITPESPSFEASLLDEYKELLRENISENLIMEFMRKNEKSLSLKEKIYLRLRTNEPSLHEEAIEIIKTHKVSYT